MTSPNGDALSVRITAAAKDAGYPTPKALADAAGIPNSNIYRKLRRPGSFKIEELEAIADVVGISVSDLFKAA